ncbi:hypothetical protein SP15_277 [Bacillus phage SP-15]|uniref:Uncharacterized protein n=1 Tax=Bacillus phage SP-15 TaxID=1792032 RepID=A0A127AWQ7_9CAUD|nr:hypothetical protein SP15_277 [Bacillus phage SP-15]AMM45085.1 hypothetical protein SP15_277 [Bacillus phage SP-15]
MHKLKGEIIIVPNGGGTVYVSDVIEVNNKWYAICTPIVPADNAEINKEVESVLEEHPDALIIYLYELRVKDNGDIEVWNPEHSDLSEVITKIKQLDFSGELN